MKLKLLLILLISSLTFAQVSESNAGIYAKEFSKDIALFKAKAFLFQKILGTGFNTTSFEAYPLAASSSGELTSLAYRCEEKNKEGLILGFYGDYWNDSGVVYQGYAFKHFTKEEATEFLSLIETNIEEHKKYLIKDTDNNNIYFSYKNIDVLLWSGIGSSKIRLFWNGFDASWESESFNKTKRRFERKMNK